MARTQIPTVAFNRFTPLSTVGAIPGSTVNGHYLINTDNIGLIMINAAGTPQTVTVVISSGVDQNLTAPNRIYTIPATTTQYVYGFPAAVYGDIMSVNVSSTSISLLAFALTVT